LAFCNLKSYFSTPIRGVNQEGRIHNIGVALSKFDGMRVEPEQVISFNSIIGNTTKENGYALAKVIINGKYEDDYGGGVCQASTTLYNALLLADIEVLQANPHSLKVGYVEGAFDSMVSYGLSDLVFKNNTGGPIFISTFCNADSCGATIYGSENLYDIVRRSEQIEVDQEKFPKVSSKYEGFLDYYKNGEKQFEKKIRKDNYYKLNAESV
jgi:vancomycin resistance protein YoaR